MPSIKIFEEDLTRGGNVAGNTNIVYVPGFMNIDKVAEETVAPARTPILCTNLTDFECYFGTEPATLKDVEDGVDKSYLYAKELISMGIPVLYESLNGVEDTYASVEVSESNMLNTLASTGETGIYAKLKDRGEYQFKYLTSGGYGNFQVKAKTTTTIENTPTLKPEIVGSNTDKTFKNNTTITYNGNNKWNYSDGTNTIELTMETKATETNTSKDYTIKTISTNADYIKFTILDKDDVAPIKGDKINLKIAEDGSIQSTSNIVWAVRITIETSETTTDQIAKNMAAITLSDTKSGETTGRGDCIALIDHANDQDIELTGDNSIYAKISTFAKGQDGAENCAAFTPWVNVFFTQYVADDKEAISMPPSFAYLTALAKSLRTNASWLAVAGATRGQIPNIDVDKPLNIKRTLTNSIAESYQNRNSVSINAITNIKPFGYRIWGNRTLKDNSIENNLTATSFLNTKTMICDVKKVVWDACRKYMFEQNNDVLWLNFKSYIEPTLDQMKTGAGLSGYKIIKEPTNEKAKLVATIKLYPLYAVEDFEVTVQMLDNEIAVS